jgi:hypothetical protein
MPHAPHIHRWSPPMTNALLLLIVPTMVVLA